MIAFSWLSFSCIEQDITLSIEPDIEYGSGEVLKLPRHDILCVIDQIINYTAPGVVQYALPRPSDEKDPGWQQQLWTRKQSELWQYSETGEHNLKARVSKCSATVPVHQRLVEFTWLGTPGRLCLRVREALDRISLLH